MLSDSSVIATIPVKDVNASKEFYEGKLGLRESERGEDGAVKYQSGNAQVLVYQSAYAGTNQGTTASWEVSNFDEVMSDLRNKGITFEHYEIPGATRDGDVHLMGERRAAWFKDPDGNILNITNQ